MIFRLTDQIFIGINAHFSDSYIKRIVLGSKNISNERVVYDLLVKGLDLKSQWVISTDM